MKVVRRLEFFWFIIVMHLEIDARISHNLDSSNERNLLSSNLFHLESCFSYVSLQFSNVLTIRRTKIKIKQML